MSESSDFIRVGDARIYCRVAGQGEDVVLLHCSSSHSGQWRAYVEALQDRYRVWTPDLHGYGKSDGLPRDGQPWFVHDGKMVAEILAQIGKPAHVIGHSLGGATAFYAARNMKDRVRSLMMIEPVLFPLLEEAKHSEMADAWHISSTLHSLLWLDRDEAAAEAFVDFWSVRGAWMATDERIKSYIIQTIRRVCDDWAGMEYNLPGQVRLSDFHAFDVPTMLVRGTKTRASASAIVDLVASVLPRGEIVDLPGVGHMAAVTNSDCVMPVIEAWLEGQDL